MLLRAPLLSVFDVAEDARRRERNENTASPGNEDDEDTMAAGRKHGKKA